MERCKNKLEPEELDKFEESKVSLPTNADQISSLSVSEKILLKYKRSTELCSLFEQKYQSQVAEIKELTLTASS